MHPTLKFFFRKKGCIMRALLFYLFFSPVHLFGVFFNSYLILASLSWQGASGKSQAFWCKTGLKITSVFHSKGKSIRPVGKRRIGILIN